MDTPLLGFVPPRRRTLYMARQHAGMLWYFWNGQEAEKPPEDALAGHAKALAFVPEEYKGKTSYKLILQVGQEYAIKAGIDSTAGRGLLLALSALSHDDLKQPLRIAVEEGDDEKVLLCNVSKWVPPHGDILTGYWKRVFVEGWPSTDAEWKEVNRKAGLNVNGDVVNAADKWEEARAKREAERNG